METLLYVVGQSVTYDSVLYRCACTTQSKRNFASEVRRLRELSRAATAAASAAGGLPALMHSTAAAAHTAIHASLLPSLAATSSRLSE